MQMILMIKKQHVGDITNLQQYAEDKYEVKLF